MRRVITPDLPVVFNGTTLAISKANVGFVPETVSGTPDQHALYRENVIKVWANVSVTPGLNDSFNMTSVADGGAGLVTMTWDRDFANSTYAAAANAAGGAFQDMLSFNSLAAGTMTVNIYDHAGAAEDRAFTILVVGDQ